MPALAVGLLELSNQLFYFFYGDCVFFFTCILIEQRVVHDKLVQFRLFVALPPSNAIDSEVVLTYWAELLVILRSLGEFPASGEGHSLDMIVRLRGECPLIKARVLKDVLKFLVERGLYFPKILMKLLER